LEEFDLNNQQIDNLFNKNNYIPIKYIDEKNQIKTTYKYKAKTKNYIFYECARRNKISGKGKIDINKKEFYIVVKYDSKIDHNYLFYEEFKIIFKNKKLDDSFISKKFIQKY